MLGKLAIHVQKNEIVPYFISHLTPYIQKKINSKCNKYLNVSPGNVKTTRRKHSESWILAWADFGGYDPKTQATKAKIEKWDLIKLKACSTENENNQQSEKDNL